MISAYVPSGAGDGTAGEDRALIPSPLGPANEYLYQVRTSQSLAIKIAVPATPSAAPQPG